MSLDLLHRTCRYSAWSPKRLLSLCGDKAEPSLQDTQWCCSLQMSTLHIHGNFCWPGLKKWWERMPWQRKSLHLAISMQIRMLQFWTQGTLCPNEAWTTRQRSKRLQDNISSTVNWKEHFCLGYWQLTFSTSDTTSHLSPDENHFKPQGLRDSLLRISK